MNSNDAPTVDTSPHVRLVEMATASYVSMIVHAAAKFGLADHLGGGSKSAEELSGITGTHAPSLYWLMRTLAGLGTLIEDAAQCFSLTPLGEALKTGAEGSARASIHICGRLHVARHGDVSVFC